MNPPNPEDLEKLIQRTLRTLPPRSAPATLERRVMEEITRRKAQRIQGLGWLRKLGLLRILMVLLSLAAGAALCSLFWRDWSQPTPGWLPVGLGAQIERIWVLASSVTDAFGAVFRSIPTLWFYGGMAAIAILYSALFGLGATAYRVLVPQRE